MGFFHRTENAVIRIRFAAPQTQQDIRTQRVIPTRLILVKDGLGEVVLPAVGCAQREPDRQHEAADARIAQRLAVRSAVGSPVAWPTPPRRNDPVSVVVGTKDRPAQLRRCLCAIGELLRAVDDLIVVDNSVTGSARRVTEEAGARWLPEVRPGVAFARNRGAAAARHSLVLFLDDDGTADRCLLDALVEPFADPEVVAVTGAVLGRNPGSVVGRLFDERYPFFRGWTVRHFAGSTGTHRSPLDAWRVGTGAVMAWRKVALRDLGGFDPALGEGTPAGGAEDLDLFRRTLASGRTIVYTPRAVLWHDHPATRSELSRKMRHYAITDAAHAAKVAVEDGHLDAVKMVTRQWARLPRRVATEGARRLRHQTALPLTPLLTDPMLAFVGVHRFLRHRGKLRSLLTNEDWPNAHHGSSASL